MFTQSNSLGLPIAFLIGTRSAAVLAAPCKPQDEAFKNTFLILKLHNLLSSDAPHPLSRRPRAPRGSFAGAPRCHCPDSGAGPPLPMPALRKLAPHPGGPSTGLPLGRRPPCAVAGRSGPGGPDRARGTSPAGSRIAGGGSPTSPPTRPDPRGARGAHLASWSPAAAGRPWAAVGPDLGDWQPGPLSGLAPFTPGTRVGAVPSGAMVSISPKKQSSRLLPGELKGSRYPFQHS